MSYQLEQIERECLNYLGGDFAVADTLRMVRELIERDKRNNTAIAAAVQTEREACAKVADAFEVEAAYRLKNHAVTADAKQQRTAQMDASSNIAAAIRARSNGSGRK